MPSPPAAAAGLSHAVDRLVISGGRLFGWGWAADATRVVTDVHLRLAGEGWEQRVPGALALARHDVEEAFPHLVNARTSGFVLTGFIPPQPAASATLEVDLDDGTRASIDVTKLTEARYAEKRTRRLLAWVAAAVWRRLRHGDFRGILNRARAQRYAGPTLGDLDIEAKLGPLLRDHARVGVVFDHSMGGGANQYCRNIVAERIASGEAIVLCTYNLPMLEYRLVLHRPGEEPLPFGISSFMALEHVLERIRVDELFVNSPVSFDEPLLLAEWLARMRERHPHVRLTVTAHDYFAVCPSFVLLNAEGRYCGIPDLAECARCLAHHPASYVALSPPTEIGPWRALWGRCLQAADEIRCFSESTREHLLRAYPSLDRSRISVVPHRVDFKPSRLPRIDPMAPLVIGVVGEISPQKGALVVKEIVERIDRDHPDVRLVVLGTLNMAHKSERLRITGAYQRDELAGLIEKHGVNMFLFPSVWPETFSYVVAELVALEVPVVAFDLGAPAERLRHYPKARLVPRVDAAQALDTLIAFHGELAASALGSAA